MTTRVFCTSTRTPIAGSTRDSASTASTEWKKVSAGPAEAIGDLHAHDAEVEQPGQQARVEHGALVHLADARPDFPGGEVENRVVEEPFVVGQRRKRGRTRSLRAHGRNAIIAKMGQG